MADDVVGGAGFHMAGDYLALPREPQPWIIEKVIPAGGLVNLYGVPKAGKSFAGIGISMAIASGLPSWLGFKVCKQGRVAYLQVDTPRSAWHYRLEKIKAAGYPLDNIYFADKLTSPYPFDILQPAHCEWLKKEIERVNPIVVIFDTLREIHSGDENDSTIMRNVISNLVEAIGQERAGVLISHSRKLPAGTAGAFGGDDLMNDARGSSYVAGRMDSVIKLSPKQMSYKGRSIDSSTIKIQRDPETGLVVKDITAAEEEQIVQDIMSKRDSTMSQNRLAGEIAAAAGISTSTGKRRVSDWLEKHGGKVVDRGES